MWIYCWSFSIQYEYITKLMFMYSEKPQSHPRHKSEIKPTFKNKIRQYIQNTQFI